MSWMIERRLRRVGRRLQRARDDLAVADHQLGQLAAESDDAGVRALVSDDPEAGLDRNAANRHRDAMARHRQDLVAAIARLEAEQDRLLDRMTAGRSGSW